MDMTEYKDIVVYIETADKSPVKVGLEMLSPARKIAEKKGREGQSSPDRRRDSNSRPKSCRIRRRRSDLDRKS